MSKACFFSAPIRLNLTSNTWIPDCPTSRFLFLALIAIYILMKFSPTQTDLKVTIWSSSIHIDLKGGVSGPFYVTIFVNLSSFLVFIGVGT